MPICVVPNCATNKYKSAEKCSTFQVPTDENLRAKWIASIPGVESLRSTQRVCEKHFEEHFIVKEFIKYDNTGKIIAQVPFKRARLQKEAVPTIFEQSQSRSKSPRKVVEVRVKNYTDHSRLLQEPSTSSHSRATIGCELVNTSTTLNCDTNVATQSLDEFGDNEQILPNNNKCLSAHVSVEADIDVHCHLIDSSTMKNELPYEESNVTKDNIEAPMHTNSACSFTIVTFDSVKFNFNAKPGDDTFANDCPLKLPKPWNVCKSTTEKEETLLFTYVVTANDRGTEKHIFEKTLIITSSREIKYEIYMTPSDVTGTKLPRVLDNISMLPDILKKFKDMRVCKGITSIGLEFVPGNTSLKVCAGADWRHADCKMLSVNSERCSSCKKYSNALSQKVRRMKKRTNIKRVSASSNHFEDIKLNAIRKKMKYQQVKAHRLGKKLDLLTNYIANQQEKVASMTDDVLGKISKYQKIVISEIISAAKKTDPRGRRYTDEFIMLCMLMNIRSQSYYEFLRRNDIIPLPCSKTVRDYMSLIGTKCGFDTNFFEILKKFFAAKDKQKCHGVLVLDEINLRKSVAVSSKTLTYTGLTDFGDDGPRSSDINNLATHGLVLLFQSLTEKCTQPIAVFASKNSVGGKDLAKIVLKAICLIENAGAVIHGVIGDGASTNRRMWKTLGIDSSIDNLHNWFTHPLDEGRKIFMFSDTPHLIKCIRNRLYNKGRLCVNSKHDYVQWKYFSRLYNIDNTQAGNARVCPKISRRHVELDNTAKMRVRFATQIFSNSVAVGLRFYLAHNTEQFQGCEETVDFCLRINNLFDALNRKQPNEGLTPESKDYKVLEDALKWLNQWETDTRNGIIPEDEFLTKETGDRLRVTIKSTLDLCNYLIEKYDFKYLLTGKVNQDNLEKFFGTIRGAVGTNEHPTCATFLLLYKLLSVYSIIRPPKYGNCTVSEKVVENVISVSDIKEIYGKSKSTSAAAICKLKTKIDDIIRNEDWEVNEVIERDYTLSPVLHCIIYYVTGSF